MDTSSSVLVKMSLHRKNKYTTALKLKVIEMAEKTNNCVAAREFCISEKLVRDWRKNSNQLKKMPRQKCANRGKLSKWPDLENKVAEWIRVNRKSGICVSRQAIRIYALIESNKDGVLDFKASAGWFSRFRKRHDLMLQRKTNIAERFPAELDKNIIEFHRCIIKSRLQEGYRLSCIGNMDESPIFFYMPEIQTVSHDGENTIFVKTTGHEKIRFTLVLSCMADGTKLKPMAVFRRKTLPKETFPEGIVIHVHPQGWMDEDGCRKWSKEVWNYRPGGQNKEKSLLIWDQFRSHIIKNVVDDVRSHNTDIAVIPSGLASVLQPIDVGISRLFKDMMRHRWNNWLCDGDKTYTEAGGVRAPPLPLISAWIINSWNEIKIDTIIKSFKKCGISNALDGTEDDYLWSDRDEDDINDLHPLIGDEDDDPYDDIIHQNNCHQFFNANNNNDITDQVLCDFPGF